MEQSEIFKKVRSIISEQLDKKEDEITMESRFVEDLGADSLDIYELLYLLEEAFDDKIPENEASEFETIGDVVAFIEKKGLMGILVMKLDKDRKRKLDDLLMSLHINFNDIVLLNMSLIHSSYANEFDQGYSNNERLEFLGDSVLNLIITDYLYKFYPDKSEGELSKARSYIVSEESLSSIARELNLGNYLLLGRGEESNDGRNKKGILADAIEAFVGALYLDSGFLKASAFVVELFEVHIRLMFNRGDFKDYKSLLQEYVQKKYKISPSYKLVKELGPDHNKIFCVELYVNDKFISNGKGRSKKEAEMIAAEMALKNVVNIDL